MLIKRLLRMTVTRPTVRSAVSSRGRVGRPNVMFTGIRFFGTEMTHWRQKQFKIPRNVVTQRTAVTEGKTIVYEVLWAISYVFIELFGDRFMGIVGCTRINSVPALWEWWNMDLVLRGVYFNHMASKFHVRLRSNYIRLSLMNEIWIITTTLNVSSIWNLLYKSKSILTK